MFPQPGQQQQLGPDSFEYKWQEVMVGMGVRYFEKECALHVSPLIGHFRRCLSRCNNDPYEFNRCIQTDDVNARFAQFQQCAQGLEQKLGQAVNSEAFGKLQECAQMGDSAPKSCNQWLDKFAEQIAPKSKYPSNTPVMDEFNGLMNQVMQMQMQGVQQGGPMGQ